MPHPDGSMERDRENESTVGCWGAGAEEALAKFAPDGGASPQPDHCGSALAPRPFTGGGLGSYAREGRVPCGSSGWGDPNVSNDSNSNNDGGGDDDDDYGDLC